MTCGASAARASQRADTVRKAFNSPFRPFILATTSIGQEGLDFHTYCHAVYHWNLPRNPVDLEQREGRVHRYKGHAVRKNVAERYGADAYRGTRNGGACAARDPWKVLFRRARDERPPDSSDLVPYWIFEHGDARVERRVPMLPFSSEVDQLRRLLGSLAVYRLAFGQPRQEDLVEYLRTVRHKDADEEDLNRFRISLRAAQGDLSGRPRPREGPTITSSLLDPVEVNVVHAELVAGMREDEVGSDLQHRQTRGHFDNSEVLPVRRERRRTRSPRRPRRSPADPPRCCRPGPRGAIRMWGGGGDRGPQSIPFDQLVRRNRLRACHRTPGSALGLRPRKPP